MSPAPLLRIFNMIIVRGGKSALKRTGSIGKYIIKNGKGAG